MTIFELKCFFLVYFDMFFNFIQFVMDGQPDNGGILKFETFDTTAPRHPWVCISSNLKHIEVIPPWVQWPRE